MRQSKKIERDLENLRKFLLKHGHNADQIDTAFEDIPRTKVEASLTAEAVLQHLLKPQQFIMKTCRNPECAQKFSTNYTGVSYCSDACRAKVIQELTGVRWNPMIDRWERLGAQPPLIVSPEAYKCLIEFAEVLLKQNQLEISQDQDEEPRLVEVRQEARVQFPQEVPQPTSEVHTSLDFSLPELNDL